MTMPGGADRAIILVADDDEDLRCVIERLLYVKGFGVVGFANGASALEYVAAAADGARTMPSAILLDFVMPELSGIGVLRTLRRFVELPPAILMTGFRDRSVETCALRAGFSRIVHKPIEATELCDALADVLLRARRRTRSNAAREQEAHHALRS